MLDWLSNLAKKWAQPSGDEAYQLYADLAAASRNPRLYEKYGIADTLDGRFDTLSLLVILVLRRLYRIKDKGRSFGQEVVDVMFADMDLSLHEIGVSENKVSKKVKIMARAFLGRYQAYTESIDRADEALLTEALARNLYRDNGTDPVGNGLVGAVLAEARRLDDMPDSELLAGNLGAMKLR